MKTKNPVILIIRDGWGYNSKKKDNLISLAKTPNEDFYSKNYPHGLLATSGEAVGLETGYQGNSEVGHSTLGSGRVIFQSLARIDKDIKTGDFYRNKVLLELINKCKKNKTQLHLIGLIQDRGVHAHIRHLFALLDLCKKNNFKNVLIHVITDGRDAPVTESLRQLLILNKKITSLGFGKIVSLSGRYFTMDRDKRWERIKKAYDCIALGQGEEFENASVRLKKCYENGETDEFIIPRRLKGYSGFSRGDGVIFFNFRTDRTRQLTQAIVEKKFTGFNRKRLVVNFVAMTQYYKPMSAKVAFADIVLNNLFGEVVSRAGLKQLRISETEKYAHVTFFFNGQKEKPNKGETRILINSPKIATYDLQPEMSVYKISDRLIKEIKKGIYDFIVVNLVNCDLVGHTGKRIAIIKAVEAVDKAQGEIIKAALQKKYTCLVLADHGNAENKSSATATSHTTNPVPVILVSDKTELKRVEIKKGGGLKDVAPTILKIMGLKIPKEMDGTCFFK